MNQKSNNQVTSVELRDTQLNSESLQEDIIHNSTDEPNSILTRKNVEDRTIAQVVHHCSTRIRSLKNTWECLFIRSQKYSDLRLETMMEKSTIQHVIIC